MSVVVDVRFAGGPILVESERQVVGIDVITVEAPSEVIPLRPHEAIDLALAIADHLPDDEARSLSERLATALADRTAAARTIRRPVGVNERLQDLEG